MSASIPAVVVGGGYAGLAASHYLSLAGIEHVVLERGHAGETWRAQRWDSFAMNTNRRHTAFEGEAVTGQQGDGFALRDEFVRDLERWVAARGLPLRTGVTVTAVEGDGPGGAFPVRARNGGAEESFTARNVIVASGFQNVPVVPAASAQVPRGVLQMHAAEYRNPSALPEGAVLVVGSAQSGCQIAEDLLEAGRRVYVSASRVARAPRRWRGRDILDWFIDTGFFEVRVQDLEDPKMQFAAQPQVSGVGPLGRTVSLQQLARAGATLVGKLRGAEGDVLHFDEGLAECVRFGDERSAFFQEDDRRLHRAPRAFRGGVRARPGRRAGRWGGDEGRAPHAERARGQDWRVGLVHGFSRRVRLAAPARAGRARAPAAHARRLARSRPLLPRRALAAQAQVGHPLRDGRGRGARGGADCPRPLVHPFVNAVTYCLGGDSP
jgi:hypothetical protein